MRWLIAMLVLASCADERALSGPCAGDCTARIHPAGILDPGSDAFHGRELARRNWDFALCAGCHGADAAIPEGCGSSAARRNLIDSARLIAMPLSGSMVSG